MVRGGGAREQQRRHGEAEQPGGLVIESSSRAHEIGVSCQLLPLGRDVPQLPSGLVWVRSCLRRAPYFIARRFFWPALKCLPAGSLNFLTERDVGSP